MYRILLGCINSPDLTMHFGTGLVMIENGFNNDREWVLIVFSSVSV